jgi:rare lipoprotein A (peptidoglycan hydrolase)
MAEMTRKKTSPVAKRQYLERYLLVGIYTQSPFRIIAYFSMAMHNALPFSKLYALAIAILLMQSCASSVRFSSLKSTEPRSRTLEQTATNTPSSQRSSPPQHETDVADLTTTEMTFRGMASYYGNEFQGRKTASGERYDRNEFSAAHRTLPFGTMLKVRNPANDRSVVVRVNDRGPWKETRVLDLSFAAAQELELISFGTASVEATVMK